MTVYTKEKEKIVMVGLGGSMHCPFPSLCLFIYVLTTSESTAVQNDINCEDNRQYPFIKEATLKLGAPKM